MGITVNIQFFLYSESQL